jgi:hypothetical protein
MSDRKTTTIRGRIHQVDPYAGFNVEDYPEDRQGWGSYHPVFAAVLKRLTPKLIIELGSWKGASAIHMAGLCRDMAKQCEVVCVDTWLGSQANYMRPIDEFYRSLRHVNGFPSLYYTFLGNVKRAGFADVITPLPLPSQLAAQVLRHYGAKADMIYIDAAHDYASVKGDLESYWPLLTENGVLIGDDYVQWPGVTKAANEFAGEMGRPLFAMLRVGLPLANGIRSRDGGRHNGTVINVDIKHSTETGQLQLHPGSVELPHWPPPKQISRRARMQTKVVQTIIFGRDGNSAPYHTDGWSGLELGRVWQIGVDLSYNGGNRRAFGRYERQSSGI